VLAAGIIILLLVGGIVGTTTGLIQAQDQRGRAELAAEAERLAKIDAQEAAAAERMAKESAQKRLTQIEKGNAVLESIFTDVDPRSEQKEGKPLRLLLGDRLEKAASQLDEEAVGDPTAVARLQRRLAKSLQGLGYPGKAVPLYLKARATLTARLGPDNAETIGTMGNLALAYRSLGKLDLALPLQREAYNLALARFGVEDPNTLLCMHNLAACYVSAKKLDLAIPLLEETLKLRKAKLGPDDPETLLTMNGLGLAYQTAGKLNLAIPLLEETLQRSRARLGSEHPEILPSLNNLAMAYRADGKLDLALPRFEEVLRIITAQLGPDHPNTLTTMNNLAYGYRTAGKLDLALPLALQAVAGVQKRNFEHEYAGNFLSTLIDCYEQLKQFDQADAWRHKWLAVVKNKSGEQSPAYALELVKVGLNLLQRKKWAEAEPFLRQCLAIRQAKEANYWSTFATQSLLGEALLGQKQYAAAEPLLVQGYTGMKEREAKITKDGPAFLTQALERLVHLYDAWDKPDEAAKWRQELEALRKPANRPSP
jgi:hypothetical protein